MKRTLIRCGRLISMDDQIGQRANIDLLIEGDRIAAIDAGLPPGADDVIDASDMIVMPGLINMHLHTFQAGFRAVGSEWLGPDYFRIFYGDIATRYSADDNYLGTLFGALNQLDSGVTTLLDYSHNIRSLEQAERSVDGLIESGIRALYIHGDGLREPAKPGQFPASRPHPRERVEALIKSRFSQAGRVKLGLGIAGPHWADWDASLHNARLARDFGLLASSHVTKSSKNAIVPDGYDRLAIMGLLGPDHNLVHCNHLTTDELKRLLDVGCSVTCTNMNELHDYPHPTAMMNVLALGATPSIGLDVEAMVAGDLWREMQAALLFARIENLKRELFKPMVPSLEALRWVTTAGAKGLMMEREIGVLKPGAKADIIMLRSNDLNLFPVHNPVYAAVEQSHAGNVDTVIVDGIVRKRGGELLFDPVKRRELGARLIESVRRLSAEAGYTLPFAAGVRQGV